MYPCIQNETLEKAHFGEDNRRYSSQKGGTKTEFSS